jgi:hypothetical protein
MELTETPKTLTVVNQHLTTLVEADTSLEEVEWVATKSKPEGVANNLSILIQKMTTGKNTQPTSPNLRGQEVWIRLKTMLLLLLKLQL